MQKILPLEKQQEIMNAVFGKKPVAVQANTPAIAPAPSATQAQPAPSVEKTPAQQAEDEYVTSWKTLMENKRNEIEQQRTDAVKMAKYNALGNALTTMVQPLGWAIGGGMPGQAGVQSYDNRGYLEAFNRAVKATDDLRNIGAAEDEFNFKMAGEKYREAKEEAKRQQIRQEQNDDYEKKRQLDAQYGVNRAKTGEALYEERKTRAVDAWTIHNNGMTLAEYMDSIQAAHPGYFGENYTPDREALDKIQKQIEARKKKKQAPVIDWD